MLRLLLRTAHRARRGLDRRTTVVPRITLSTVALSAVATDVEPDNEGRGRSRRMNRAQSAATYWHAPCRTQAVGRPFYRKRDTVSVTW